MLELDGPEDCHNGVKDKDNEQEKTTQIRKTKTTPMKMTETKKMKFTKFSKGVGVMYADGRLPKRCQRQRHENYKDKENENDKMITASRCDVGRWPSRLPQR